MKLFLSASSVESPRVHMIASPPPMTATIHSPSCVERCQEGVFHGNSASHFHNHCICFSVETISPAPRSQLAISSEFIELYIWPRSIRRQCKQQGFDGWVLWPSTWYVLSAFPVVSSLMIMDIIISAALEPFPPFFVRDNNAVPPLSSSNTTHNAYIGQVNGIGSIATKPSTKNSTLLIDFYHYGGSLVRLFSCAPSTVF